MSYFVFDLDETLAQVYSVYYFLCDLRPAQTIGPSFEKKIPESLKAPLQMAYTSFVKQIAQAELSSQPLGLLRPGILNAMFGLSYLQRTKLIKGCIIYSNNGALSNLELVRDVIQMVVGNNELFCDLIDWTRKGREEEYILPPRPGYANKTWSVLSKLLKTGPCHASESILPNDVFFFDDLIHPDLQKYLQHNYIQVKPYKFKASFDRLSDMYVTALTEANILPTESLKQQFLAMASQGCSGRLAKTIEEHIERYKNNTAGSANSATLPPVEDESMNLILQLIEMMTPFQNNIQNLNNYSNSFMGGKRRLRRTRIHRRNRLVKKDTGRKKYSTRNRK